MTIVRLTYYSRNRIERAGAPMHDRIHDILIESVANNRRDDITGALIHDDKWFAQALEGPEAVVSATFERILRDPRHCEVRLIKMQPVEIRPLLECPALPEQKGENDQSARPDRDRGQVWGLSTAQWVSVAIVGTLAWAWTRRARRHRVGAVGAVGTKSAGAPTVATAT